MVKFLLYFLVLTALTPLTSSAKVRPRAGRHVSEIRNINPAAVVISPDSVGSIMPFIPFQDSLHTGGQKRIKEVGRSKPQSIPEKVDRNDPNDRPADNSDRGNGRPPADRPPADRAGVRPGGRPAGGMGGGARPQAPPPRRGGR
ncbi:MAG TPA: hypothetical protein DIT07_06035 [Sphingobacteriaceae bacterium]|nr:hypothetical protein [Sphingobacteriaceae bacterium]